MVKTQPMPLSVSVVSGAALSELLPRVAELRLKVFQEYPYLYRGTLAEEQEYLDVYTKTSQAMFVVARYQQQVVGVSTCIPLAGAQNEVQRPFLDARIPLESVLYLGESVLLPGYRGQGLYRRFFEERHAHGRRLPRIQHCFFCTVERPADHPQRPTNHRPLDVIWEHFGYTRREDLRATLSWQEMGQEDRTDKSMVFWGKRL